MIGLSRVTAGYEGRTVLRDVSLTLAPRGITVLTGPSGEGKTTVLRLLAGLMPPQAGRVHPALRPAVLFQENRLFPQRTALEHLLDVLPPNQTGQAPLWMALADLTGEEAALPGELSGGMARRLALVRALALGGDCLLLDEPFTGVDAPRREIFLELLARWPVPVLLITHEAQECRGAEKVIAL